MRLNKDDIFFILLLISGCVVIFILFIFVMKLFFAFSFIKILDFLFKIC